MSWELEFEEPVPLPRGRSAATLRDAATYITKLPKAEAEETRWQTAMEVLLAAAEKRGPLMHARIGMMQALRSKMPPVAPKPLTKDPHWGRRKLARDR